MKTEERKRIVFDWMVKETTATLERMRDNGHSEKEYADYKEKTTQRCFALDRWLRDGNTVDSFTG